MQLNGSALNSVELNGARRNAAPHETEIIELGGGSRWRLRVLVNNQDLSHRLTGTLSIDREEGAARLVELSLVPEPGALDIDGWTGTPIQVYRQQVEGNAVVSETLRFTGIVRPPHFTPTSRVVRLTGTCDLQNRVEQMTIEQIDVLVPGDWSAAVFGELSSHWRYAQDRLATRQASLDCAVDGTLRVTSWTPASVPHFILGADAILDGTLDVTPAEAGDLINRVELTVEFRFVRLRHREHIYQWTNPAGNFCGWYVETFELPTRNMLLETLEQADWTAYAEPGMVVLPDDMENPCGLGGGWFNEFTADPHLLSFSALVARRTAQTFTERYSILLEATGSIAAFGERQGRESYSDDVEYDSRSWESLPPEGRPLGAVQDNLGDWVIDKDEGTRRDAVLRTAIKRETTRIAESHRQTRVSFQTPLVDQLYDTHHTIRAEALGVAAQGKVVRVQEVWDIEAGTEVATLELAVFRGGEAVATDPILLPARPDFDLGTPPEATTLLATQLGGRPESPPFNEDLDGFSGNYSVIFGGTETYDRQLRITTPDIEEQYRDPVEAETAATYRLGLRTDLLQVEAL